jgi:glutamate N-acetyltransferase / amino-acid N-acetyltransferase
MKKENFQMKSHWRKIDGGVCAPLGFQAASATCGLKVSGKSDIGILSIEKGANAFGVFTKNQFAAAPVIHSKNILSENIVLRGVVVNSGNANACTGRQGLDDAKAMGSYCEDLLKAPQGSFLVCSTGVIGRPLDMNKVRSGISEAVPKLNEYSGTEFAKSIMTTDTFLKEIALEVSLEAGTIRIGGCSKGAGMIHPDMATMLAFVSTDLGLEADFQDEFKELIQLSFNSITVDGDTSTNDTCLLFASASSQLHYRSLSLGDKRIFRDALFEMFTELARLIVKDGEGATRFAEIVVRGTKSTEDARKIGRYIANSKLVKTALFGGDPNWGRIICSLGTAGVLLDPENVSLTFEEIPVFNHGKPLSYDLKKLEEIFSRSEYRIFIDLAQGDCESRVWTCDLSYEYVKINAEYTT